MCWLRRLAGFGEKACREGFGVEPFKEKHRNIHTFGRRESRLPEQRDGDVADYRSLLHRDGSVLSAVSLQVRPLPLTEFLQSKLCQYPGMVHDWGPHITAGQWLSICLCPLQDLEKPEQMYRKLGAKLVVGMPFKDQACSDTLVLPEVPAATDTDKRRALARLQARFRPCFLELV